MVPSMTCLPAEILAAANASRFPRRSQLCYLTRPPLNLVRPPGLSQLFRLIPALRILRKIEFNHRLKSVRLRRGSTLAPELRSDESVI